MKLVIFDFDNTIANTHIRDYSSQPFQFLGDTNWPLLVSQLVNKGIHVGIASFNKRDLILSYVTEWCPEFFDEKNVVGNNGMSGDKLKLIGRLMDRYSVVLNKDVVFFDDDFKNVFEAREVGIMAYHVQGDFFRVDKDWVTMKAML